jgi:hypothetical protein
MTTSFEEEVRALRSEPPGPGYEAIDQAVWRGIADVRLARKAAPVFYALRAAAVMGALGLGVAGGGATAMALASEAKEISAFSINSKLAPSTLLDHHG